MVPRCDARAGRVGAAACRTQLSCRVKVPGSAARMRILFDHGTPVPLRHALANHTVSTAYEMSWTQLSNGALLKEANARFDALITTDRNLRYHKTLPDIVSLFWFCRPQAGLGYMLTQRRLLLQSMRCSPVALSKSIFPNLA